MQTKTCFKCGEEKPAEGFYKHSAMADGRLNKCKDCAREDVRQNRAQRAEYYKAYDRARYRADPKRQDACRSVNKVRRNLTPEERRKQRRKLRARGIAYRLLKNGQLIRPVICPQCMRHMDDVGKIQMHHPDYDKPDEVVWMCPKCHGLEHSMPIMGLPF